MVDLGLYVYNESDLVGKGSYGRVYKGHDKKSNKVVAIKVVDKQTCQSQNNFLNEIVKKEIEINKTINHYNIVEMYQAIETDNQFIIVQEFCNEGDLLEHLKNNGGKIPENKAIRILKQLLQAINELMDQGIVHRDLKPDNILFNDGILKLCDFGLSEKINNFHRQKMNSYVGSPVYMSPQVLKNEDYTYKCDIWYKILPLYRNIQRNIWKYIYQHICQNTNSKIYQQNILIIYQQFINKIYQQIINNLLIYYYIFPDIFRYKAIILFDRSLGCMYYEIIMGELAFNAHSIDDLIQKQKTQNLRFKPNISKLSVDFIKKCLNYEENERLDCDQIFQHPLFENAFNYKDKLKNLDKVTIELMTSIMYSVYNNQINFQSLFNIIDKDKNGMIDIDEFSQFIYQINDKIQRHQIEHIFNIIDDDQSLQITLDEFMDYFYGIFKQLNDLTRSNITSIKNNQQILNEQVNQYIQSYKKSIELSDETKDQQTIQNIHNQNNQQYNVLRVNSMIDNNQDNVQQTNVLRVNSMIDNNQDNVQQTNFQQSNVQRVNSMQIINLNDNRQDRITQIIDKYKNRPSTNLKDQKPLDVQKIIEKYKSPIEKLNDQEEVEKRISHFQMNSQVEQIIQQKEKEIQLEQEQQEQEQDKIAFYQPVSREQIVTHQTNIVQSEKIQEIIKKYKKN